MANYQVLGTTLSNLGKSGPQVIFQPAEIRKILDRAFGVEAKANLQIRLPKKIEQSLGNLPKFDIRILDSSVPGKVIHTTTLEPRENKIFSELVSKSEDKECLLLIYLKGQILVGVHTILLANQPNRMEFKYPERIFVIQRRKDARAPIKKGYELFAILPAKKRIVDISAGGLAFHISKQEYAAYPPGAVIKKIRFRIQTREIVTDAEIRGVYPASPEEGPGEYRVGIQFTSLNKDDREWLENFVFAQIGHSLF